MEMGRGGVVWEVSSWECEAAVSERECGWPSKVTASSFMRCFKSLLLFYECITLTMERMP